MTDRANNDLAALLTPTPAKGVQFSQGIVLTWDRIEGHNTIEWRGITLTDIPFVEGVNPLVLKAGDVVGMLGWAPENAKGVGSWWILGKLSNPGEFVTDLTFNLGQIRFLTKVNGDLQAYFGSDTDSVPLTVLYYGDEAESRALVISNTDRINIYDVSGNHVFGTDALSRTGLSRPYIPYHMVPSGPAEQSGTSFWPTTTSTSYVQLFNGFNPGFHPKIDIGVGATTAGGGSAGWRFIVNGTVVHTQTGGGSAVVSIPGWGTTVSPGDTLNLEVEGRIEGGGVRAFFQVDRCFGRQS